MYAATHIVQRTRHPHSTANNHSHRHQTIPSRWSNSNDLILCACCNALHCWRLDRFVFFCFGLTSLKACRCVKYKIHENSFFLMFYTSICGNTQMQNSVMICTIRTWADYFLRPTISLSFLRFTSRCNLIYLKWFLISWAAFSVMFVCDRFPRNLF